MGLDKCSFERVRLGLVRMKVLLSRMEQQELSMMIVVDHMEQVRQFLFQLLCILHKKVQVHCMSYMMVLEQAKEL